MTETTERFFHEIATRVGYHRVAELFLFPVLRQGGVEGAVAVVAAYPEALAEQPASPDESPEESPEAIADPNAEIADSADALAPDAPASDAVDEASADGGGNASPTDAASELTEPLDEIGESPTAPAESSHRQRARHVVYTARYRHTIKGTDRGRWLVEVVAEADAPLITVEEVVRGVVRRSGDAFQPERISGDQFRAIVPAPAAPESVPA